MEANFPIFWTKIQDRGSKIWEIRNQKEWFIFCQKSLQPHGGTFLFPHIWRNAHNMEIPRIAGVFDSMVLSEVGSTKLTGNLNQSTNKMAIGYVSVDPCSATGWTDPIALGTKKSQEL